MSETKKTAKAANYEKTYEELSQIVEKLSNGNLPLEQLVTLYERGEALSKECLKILDGYEARIELIAKEEKFEKDAFVNESYGHKNED